MPIRQTLGELPYTLYQYKNSLDEILLADIAIKIQLTPSEYTEAVAHCEAIRWWLERDGSPLKDKVIRIYPQGSVSIQATISSKFDTEEFDIDLVIELALAHDADPDQVLKLLFKAIRGERGSRYYDVTSLNSRCVTVQYKNMHLDLCPAVRRTDLQARTCTMFHYNQERSERYWHIRNPWGFAEWFNSSLPEEIEFARFYEGRGIGTFRAAAEAEPVPEPTPVFQKPRKTVALQLIKRFRNHRFQDRRHKGPPSVILSKLAIDAGDSTGGLLDELEAQAAFLKVFLSGPIIEVRNPTCLVHDVLTDRWPGEPSRQREFYKDICELIDKLARLRRAADLKSKQLILADLFGERATSSAFEKLRDRYHHLADEGRIHVDSATGAVALAASCFDGEPVKAPAIVKASTTAPSSVVVTAPRHHSHASKD